jgi:hypothetical protein
MPAVRNYINKTKEDILHFLKKATGDRQSAEYSELFNNLLKMFVDCDLKKNGMVAKAQFGELVDTAASTPRMFGFAPSSKDMFASKEEETASRNALFDSMDFSGDGLITFDEFLKYTLTHIAGKAALLDCHPNIETNDKALYVSNMTKALAKGNTPEYTDLYWYLLQVYLDNCGKDFCAGVAELYVMVDKATIPARRLGIFTAELSPDAMLKVFKQIVRGERMNFNEFLAYMLDQVLKNNAV